MLDMVVASMLIAMLPEPGGANVPASGISVPAMQAQSPASTTDAPPSTARANTPPCAGIPQLVLPDDFDPRFEARYFAETRRNFETAFCTRTAFFDAQGVALVDDSDQLPTLHLLNEPLANQISISFTGPPPPAGEALEAGRFNQLSYYYVDEQGTAHVPEVEEIHYALFCAVVDWNLLEEGGCLPD